MFLAVSFKVVTVVVTFTFLGDLNIILEMRIIFYFCYFIIPLRKIN